MPTRYITTEVEVDLSDFDADELIEELEDRGIESEWTNPGDNKELLDTIWQKRRNGLDYQQELDDLIYKVLGKIV